MGKRWQVPGDVDVFARVEMVGILEQQPTATRVAIPTKWVAHGDVQVKKSRFVVIAYNDNAKLLATTPGGSVLAIKGWLTQQWWQTGGGVPRSKIEVEIEKLSVIGRSTEYVNPRARYLKVKQVESECTDPS